MACLDYLGMRDSPNRTNELETPEVSPMSVKAKMRTDHPHSSSEAWLLERTKLTRRPGAETFS